MKGPVIASSAHDQQLKEKTAGLILLQTGTNQAQGGRVSSINRAPGHKFSRTSFEGNTPPCCGILVILQKKGRREKKPRREKKQLRRREKKKRSFARIRL